jgi:hypothetical protein
MTILMLVTCVSFVSLWGCAIFLVPSHVNSLFRYKLWNLRDQFQDHIYYERLPRSAMVTELLNLFETMIRCSDDLKLSDFLAFRMARGARNTQSRNTQYNSILSSEAIAQLPKEQRELLLSFISRATDIMMLKLVTSGPFGWPIFLSQYVFGAKKVYSLVSCLFSTKRKGSEELRKPELRRLSQLHDVAMWKERKHGRSVRSLAEHAA